jgi:hydrogenase expression/formation protein HypC
MMGGPGQAIIAGRSVYNVPAVPMQIPSRDGESIVAEIDVEPEASLMMLGEEVQVGDYVLIHAGFAISRLEAEALRPWP